MVSQNMTNRAAGADGHIQFRTLSFFPETTLH
jgi:hypothetical protein